ncbi:MAG TPA: hypothetical protein VKB25_05040 [Conexibacter sp.]|nr:hypothetical protein [Conexibacter sp.]
MAGAWGTPRRIASARTAAALIAACLGLAALTLFAPSSPSYDPFAWIVWGRELMPGIDGEPFVLAGGPSWKPLPVLFTTPFALVGDAAPSLWLVVARAGLLLALAGAFALGRRLGGVLAGVVAAIALLLLADVVSLAWRGASEPLLLAALLWAFERELAGRRTLAFGLGVAAALIRPELLLFLAVYALWRWRTADGRERVVLIAGLASVVLLWVGIPALAGDPFAASSTAHNPSTRTSAGSALRGDFGLALALVWALACVAVALRGRAPAVRALAVGAVAWLTLLAAMAAAGYASPARYAMPAAACACVLAGVTVAALAQHARDARPGRLALALLLALALAAPAIERAAGLDDQIREGVAVAHAHDDLRAAVARSGGAAAMQRCAQAGWVAINHTTQSALAWELRVSLDRVARVMSRPGLLVRAPRNTATGGPPPVTLGAPLRSKPVAQAGPWTVLAMRSAGTPFPLACESRKASGSPRRIPNI